MVCKKVSFPGLDQIFSKHNTVFVAVLIVYLCVFVDGPPYPEESFDRILLDAPCSGLGQRPNMTYSWSLKEVCSYQPLQRKLFTTVIQHYNTCLLQLLIQSMFFASMISTVITCVCSFSPLHGGITIESAS